MVSLGFAEDLYLGVGVVFGLQGMLLLEVILFWKGI